MPLSPPLTTSHFNFVLPRARRYMAQMNINALVLTKAEDIYYFTAIASFFSYQFKPSPSSIIILYRDDSIPTSIILNEFEAASTQIALPTYDLFTFPVWVDVDDPSDLTSELSERPIDAPIELMLKQLQKALSKAGFSTGVIGIDSQSLVKTHYDLFHSVLENYQITDTKLLLNHVRMIKSELEIQLLTRAAQITETGINEAINKLDVNVSHAELVNAYQKGIHQFHDSQNSRFHIISIAEHFSPIYHPSGIKTKMGDLIKFDCGVEVRGYGADLARTAILGEPTKQIANLYDIILQSHLAMLDEIKPGLSMSKLFKDGIERIRKLGLKRYNRGHFGHSTGVSLALEEYPFISEQSDACFESNMVMCVETPYYGKGIGAIMIEDMIRITSTGIELLSHNPRTLTIVTPSTT
ncbi:M24 family metallopeptidase [Thorsellia anophelis]|uniref:Xaa-Pro aminopeptidase n=1 Tax=Thorsellia anophelis DSM 18579 TaxID=1123402 RepID=A0A1I0AT70_9GAMM|nr:M24 family metallopeptidase [Thorsellia anophelis]SES97590.1 Xaa-Pro aminopeptidase [Thorsellia anophelis DSM 18579]